MNTSGVLAFPFADKLLIALAIAAGSFVKGVTGMGLPMISIPILAMFIGPAQAVVVMSIPSFWANVWQMWRHKHYLKYAQDLHVLAGTGILGVLVGTRGLISLDRNLLALLLAGLIITYVLFSWRAPNYQLSLPTARRLAPFIGFLAGMLQGATGLSGPLVATYLHAYRLDPGTFVLSVTTIFTTFLAVQIVTLWKLHLYTSTRLEQSLAATTIMVPLLYLGARVGSRLPQRTFEQIVLLFLLAAAFRFLISGLLGLL